MPQSERKRAAGSSALAAIGRCFVRCVSLARSRDEAIPIWRLATPPMRRPRNARSHGRPCSPLEKRAGPQRTHLHAGPHARYSNQEHPRKQGPVPLQGSGSPRTGPNRTRKRAHQKRDGPKAASERATACARFHGGRALFSLSSCNFVGSPKGAGAGRAHS